MEAYDILRSIVTNIMLVSLLFTLAQPKYSKWTMWITTFAIVSLDFGLNIYFYLRNDYTTLAASDIVFFILVGVITKPFFKDTFMQWLFNFFTAMNIYAVTVILSYYLAFVLPYPNYAMILIRALLFGAAILLFRTRLHPLYRQTAEHWDIYLFVAAGLFANFAWYLMSGDDVVQTLNKAFVPLILLVMLVVLVYMAIFLSLRKTLREMSLREENLKMQVVRDFTSQRLALMDETVRQMSIIQHDRRHFNNTLLSLLERGETIKASELIQKQSEALPQKPRSYCENVSVNAAVSYYADLARQKGIRYEIRLDIPEKLSVDELSLAMTVSNLMENAIQAVDSLPLDGRYFRFSAVSTGQLIFEISNPYEGEVEIALDGLPISKNEGHGRGSQSISDFVSRSGGELLYEAKDGVFMVRIMV